MVIVLLKTTVYLDGLNSRAIHFWDHVCAVFLSDLGSYISSLSIVQCIKNYTYTTHNTAIVNKVTKFDVKIGAVLLQNICDRLCEKGSYS